MKSVVTKELPGLFLFMLVAILCPGVLFLRFYPTEPEEVKGQRKRERAWEKKSHSFKTSDHLLLKTFSFLVPFAPLKAFDDHQVIISSYFDLCHQVQH